MMFVEGVTGKGFIVLLNDLMQKVIIDILHRAGNSAEWGADYALPPAVLTHATDALVNLSDIQKRSDAASFLAGAHAPTVTNT